MFEIKSKECSCRQKQEAKKIQLNISVQPEEHAWSTKKRPRSHMWPCLVWRFLWLLVVVVLMVMVVCAGTCETSGQLWMSFITCRSSSFLRAVLFLSWCLLIKLNWLASEPRTFSSTPVLSFQVYSPHPAFFMLVLELKVRTWLYFLPYFLGKHFADQAVS